MLRNYLVVAWRNLARQQMYAAINILGLAVGVGAALLAFCYVYHEWSYDRFYPSADRLFLIRFDYQDDAPTVCTPPILAPTLIDQAPGFDRVTRVHWDDLGEGVPVSRPGGEPSIARGMYADPAFFRMFPLRAIAGTPETALEQVDGLVISSAMARRYFGETDPLGQTLVVFRRGQEQRFAVRGVVEVPDNSSLTFEFAIAHAVRGGTAVSDWGMCHVLTFAELPASLSREQAEERLGRLAERCIPPNTRDTFAGGGIRGMRLIPLTAMHFTQGLRSIPGVMDPRYCWAVAVVAVCVLAIACINYVNLSLGLLSRRIREVGIRKSVGATRHQLTRHFLAESGLVSIASTAIGVALAELALPGFRASLQNPFALPALPGAIAAVALAGSLSVLTGGYPAWVLSRLQPSDILRGTARFGASRYVSRGLVVLQFACSIAFAVVAMAMARQVEFLSSRTLGFQAPHLMKLDLAKAQPRGMDEYGAFMAALAQAREQGVGILSMAGANNALIPADAGSTEGTILELNGRDTQVYVFEVEAAFLETAGISVVAGRPFDPLHGSESEEAMLVNQSLAGLLGPGPVLGNRPSQLPSGDSRFTGSIVGIVSDFQVLPLRWGVQPAVFRLSSSPQRFLYVRLVAGSVRPALERMRQAWQTAFPGRPFAYSFVDDDLDNALRQDGRWIPAVRFVGTVAMLISALGVLGLSALAAVRRTKEIGIRKVLGASVPRIVVILTKEFTYLFLAANVIAWPIAWYAMHRWLESFAYRIELGPGVFVLGGLAALAIAWLTVSWQAIRAATANPVEALRYE